MPAVLTMETIMKRYQIPIMTVIVVLLCHVNALAQSTTVGIMTLNKGAVKLRRTQIDTLFQKAGEKIPVRNLDEIQTGKNSSVTIKLDAKSDELELYSQSFFKIDSVTPESSLLSMSIGKAKFKIQKGLVPLKRLKNRKKKVHGPHSKRNRRGQGHGICDGGWNRCYQRAHHRRYSRRCQCGSA